MSSTPNVKKQPTISKFFAPKQKIGGAQFRTDEEKKEKNNKVVEVNYSPTLKRTKSSDSENGSPVSEHKSKKLRVEDSHPGSSSQESSENGTSEKKSLTPWTKNRLQSFKAESSSDNEDKMEVEEKAIEPSKPVKTVSQNGVKKKLDSFKSQSSNSDSSPSSSQTTEKNPSSKPGLMKALPGMKLTPLEQQVVAIKNKNLDTVLFVECGYKYRFFGHDAEIAAKELNIVAHLDHSFMTASIPTHRLHVHVRRLVAKGYKVGVVKQTETAALKAAGSNKSAPFERQLTAMYTRSTLIGEDVTPAGGGDGVDDGDLSEGTTAMLLVVSEGKSSTGKDGTVGISLVAIQPSTGDILYDHFDDSSARTELWCRLDHIQPVEALVPECISELTVRAVTAATTKNEDCIRIERLSDTKFDYSESLKKVCELFDGDETMTKHVSGLPSDVVGCLGATLDYLAEFKLDRIIKMAGSIRQYTSEKHHMRLSGATVRNLEVIANGVDGGTKGSLFWALNNTQTKFGSRLLRRWVVQPLLSLEGIIERQDMIEELMASDAPVIVSLKNVLNKLPDFERALTTIFHKKCSPHEFWLAVSGLSRVHRELLRVGGNVGDTVQTPGLVKRLQEVLDGLSNVEDFANNIDPSSAKEGKKKTLLRDFSEFPKVLEKQKEISDVEQELKDQKPEIARALRLPCFNYTTVSGLEYLIEVKNAQLKAVPKNWTKVSSTKACCRFRSPEVDRLLTQLQQLREQLQVSCHEAWLQVLDSFSNHYQRHRQAVRCLAELDALCSLASVAKAQGYCRPVLHDNEEKGFLKITGGRHPIVSQLKHGDEQYVANDTNLQTDSERVMLVTGPNMGGKSCYMRQVALIALMAQTGSYVPADNVEMSVLDAIYTRMGAADEIYTGRSTFMVEVGETADIMHEATSHSLVILDELGRGTSTHDGVAVAMAALDYFLNEVQCLTIFVTHYLPLTEFELIYPGLVGNYHMSFIVNEEEDEGVDVVTFLYQLTSGSAGQSYGLNVARLAQVPHSILRKAAEKSKHLENICKMRRKGKEMFKKIASGNNGETKELLQELRNEGM
ncbi:DNA mismatch repair protein Msh3-like [Penaeus indicus]|uniref:DNA mismatch repair protein Msh3-like n=1 Tax=Penaeus indicus TaxID=29960 RepID=UPI00300CC55A